MFRIRKEAEGFLIAIFGYGVSEGTRTLDNWGHNPVLYQLSYTHRDINYKLP